MNLPTFTATKLDQVITEILVMSDRPSQREILTRAITEAYLLGEKAVLNVAEKAGREAEAFGDKMNVPYDDLCRQGGRAMLSEVLAAIRKEIDDNQTKI